MQIYVCRSWKGLWYLLKDTTVGQIHAHLNMGPQVEGWSTYTLCHPAGLIYLY